ncbi:hypothetical protein IV203_000508 [Nitzschia inconspicua]|uniref:Uncharacterized protein n=1 Tax=Nitzschia inconspicua TaxID=303405 RepID=A0A9K3L5M4_9STRA|nr:hypothetical protein IV203_000508 [Nitzschia inconspicua]
MLDTAFSRTPKGFPAAPPFFDSDGRDSTEPQGDSEDEQEDATLVSETNNGESGIISYVESFDDLTPRIHSPSMVDSSPGTALERNRLKKRTLESQLAAWREGIGKAKVTKQPSLKNVDSASDGPPPLVDWEESESDLASYQTVTNNSRNDHILVDSLDASISTASLPMLVDYDTPEDSLRLSQFSRLKSRSKISSSALDLRNPSDDKGNSTTSGAKFSPLETKKPRSSFRRASMGSVPLTSARMTTGGWISNIIFNDDLTKTLHNDTLDSQRSSTQASPRMRIKKERRSSLESSCLTSDQNNVGNNSIPSNQGGTLSALISQPDQQSLSHSENIVCPGKIILQCRRRSSKSILSVDSSLSSERTGTASQRLRVKSEGCSRSSRFRDKGRASSGASSVTTNGSDKSKSSIARKNGKKSNCDKLTARDDNDLASVTSYETMHSCSTRKPICRTQSFDSLASSIDSMGKANDEASKTAQRQPRKPANRQGRRNSTGHVEKKSFENDFGALTKVNLNLMHERRGSVGSKMPEQSIVMTDIVPTGKTKQSKAKSERCLGIDTNKRAPRRMSTGATFSGMLVDHVDSQHLARTSLDSPSNKQQLRQSRKMSTGISNCYAPITASLKEEIRQIAVKPKHPSSGRSISSVELWNGSNTSACTASVSSWKSSAEVDKPSSLLSTASSSSKNSNRKPSSLLSTASSSKSSNRKPDSSRTVQSKKNYDPNDGPHKQLPNIDTMIKNSPSRSRIIMNRLNIFKSKQGSNGEESMGNRHRRRASADGGTTDMSNNGNPQWQQKSCPPKGPGARRRASTGAATELLFDNPSHGADLTTTGAVFPQEPVQFGSPKRSGRAGRRLSLGLLRVSKKKGS